MKQLLRLVALAAVPFFVATTNASAQDTQIEEMSELFNIEIVGPYDAEAEQSVHPRFKSTANSAAFRCDGKAGSLGGSGDTFRRSDTRRCSAARATFPRGGFVPGLANRTYVASITPCTGGRGSLFTPEGELVARGSTRGGCPNGRATVDFCLPNGGGAVAMASKFGERGILQWETSRGVECFNILYRCTIRNGRIVPNRSGVQERGEPSLAGVCR
jgi:hypothetical protein